MGITANDPIRIVTRKIRKCLMVFFHIIRFYVCGETIYPEYLVGYFIYTNSTNTLQHNPGNIDWLVALGFLLPPRWGLFLVLLKPQIGCFLALFWFFEGWRKGKIKEVISIFMPITIAFLISFLVFGMYLTKSQFMVGYTGKTFWPASIPIGLVLFGLSLRSREKDLAIACFPFLSPYVQPYSLPLALLGVAKDKYIFILTSIGLILSVIDESNVYIISRLLEPFIRN